MFREGEDGISIGRRVDEGNVGKGRGFWGISEGRRRERGIESREGEWRDGKM